MVLVFLLAVLAAAPQVVQYLAARDAAPVARPEGGSSAAPPRADPASAPAERPVAAREAAPPGLAMAPEPAPTLPSAEGAPAPLISDDALRWAEANGFDRFNARQKLEEGEAFYLGRGAPVDFDRARTCFEIAARYEGRAALYLADMYEQGRGVVQDYRVSVSWLERSAALGDPEAQYRLGALCLEGRPGLLAVDPARGLQLLNAAAAQGHPGARATLARIAAR